ncbi:alkaline phosphatase family protein [Dyadobacter sp. CY345]|uniref:alkaline phosphatase family protein n=1 Tax=Dyadobacter sp. CY345 TaxID=2909335 RepID=UPI001F47B9DE|nr:alkaline phosphatase family protein [Dyadobacter sp. CY345]MCF2447020.1 alkaline phosphatase family protein [Dyadobacter sp. CY345]
MKKYIFKPLVAACSILMAGILCLPAQGQTAKPSRNKTLIFFFDGLRPDYITAELMPNLFAFKQKASIGTQHHSVFPTVTRVNSASYATGSYPGTHGLLGNAVYFPNVNKSKAIGTTYEDLIKVQKTESNELLTAVSLGELLQKAGEKMMVFSSGTTGQAFLQNHKVGNGAVINPELILPESLKSEVLAAIGDVPQKGSHVYAKHKWVTDALIKYGLINDGPLVSAAWLSDPDGSAHRYGIGSDQAVAALAFVDQQFGRALDSLESRGLSDKFNIIVSTDHGFVTHKGKQNLSEFLIAQGLKKDKDSDDVVVAEGAIYVKDHNEKLIKKIVSELHKEDWVGAAFTKPKKKGSMQGWVDGTLSFEVIHYNHPKRSGDILIAPNWNDDINDKGYKGTDLTTGVAGHGGSSPYEVNIALMVSGPDFKSGYHGLLPTSNIDITPTVLGIYDIAVPSTMDGRVITELFQKTKNTTGTAKQEIIRTEVKYPWGTYKLSAEMSILNKYRYFNFSRTERTK